MIRRNQNRERDVEMGWQAHSVYRMRPDDIMTEVKPVRNKMHRNRRSGQNRFENSERVYRKERGNWKIPKINLVDACPASPIFHLLRRGHEPWHPLSQSCWTEHQALYSARDWRKHGAEVFPSRKKGSTRGLRRCLGTKSDSENLDW